jgi:hypothetical protein
MNEKIRVRIEADSEKIIVSLLKKYGAITGSVA